jgi:hypothetical protein
LKEENKKAPLAASVVRVEVRWKLLPGESAEFIGEMVC